jgi:Raf kinase inhibitor-like YbhB/YbcL family protein
VSNVLKTIGICVAVVALIVAFVVVAQWDFFFPPAMALTSTAFSEGGILPVAYTCDGEGKHPPLKIGNVPKGTKSLAITMYDPDVHPNGFVHWVVYDIDPKMTSITEAALTGGTVEGLNGTKKVGYQPACPPKGTHHYEFTAYALDQTFRFVNPPDLTKLKSVMRWHVLGRATLTARYDHR